MLIIESKHENELEALLKNMDGCRIVHSDKPLEPVKQLEVIEGTCSACPHFQSTRGESGPQEELSGVSAGRSRLTLMNIGQNAQ